MAYDDIETEYHLTLRGWETGDPPLDRVETWLRHVYQQSPYSREEVSWRCTWADSDKLRSDRDQLRAKYEEFMGERGQSGSGALRRWTAIGEPL